MPHHPLLAVLAGLASAAVLAACVSGGDHAGHADDSVHAPVEGASEVTVAALDGDFQPESIDAVAGEPINVTVTNEGEALHDFTLEQADIHVNVAAGETKETSLTIDESGTYKAICTVPGHEESGMTVQVVVAE
jgi:uncharacterized cupredoxin-like copper-binding protein